MCRVTRPGRIVAAYVWDYAGKMEMLEYFWNAALELNPDVTKLNERNRFSNSDPKSLQQIFCRAGLINTELIPITIQTPFKDFKDYWEPMLGGQGPAPGYVQGLSEPERNRLGERLYQRLSVQNNGSINLTASAWAIKGNVPS